jgi:hypothetical protein
MFWFIDVFKPGRIYLSLTFMELLFLLPLLCENRQHVGDIMGIRLSINNEQCRRRHDSKSDFSNGRVGSKVVVEDVAAEGIVEGGRWRGEVDDCAGGKNVVGGINWFVDTWCALLVHPPAARQWVLQNIPWMQVDQQDPTGHQLCINPSCVCGGRMVAGIAVDTRVGRVSNGKKISCLGRASSSLKVDKSDGLFHQKKWQGLFVTGLIAPQSECTTINISEVRCINAYLCIHPTLVSTGIWFADLIG